jgi:hypothetical protein
MIVIRFDMMLLPLRLMGSDMGGRSRLHPFAFSLHPGRAGHPRERETPAGVGFPVAAGVDSSMSMPAYDRLKDW